ncbi:Signal transduction histidine-protein kinase/phosphatase DegS [bioreactor metagenome]|uniref:Signal transduction histidine-protein kinase/phosphatase DegS n=1 Tax=bioreactor metagenome TaxID=1076179 RepID=A0A645FRZ0_9ZZZZ
MCEGGSTVVQFDQIGDAQPIPNTHATALYRVAQEAVKNACTHAQACAVLVRLQFDARTIALIVQDNGQGFDVHGVLADGSRGIGLRNMRERLEALDGQFLVHSSRQGTRILACLPSQHATASDAEQPHSRFDSSYAPA